VRKTLIIQVTSDCNASCKYCYNKKTSNVLKEEVVNFLLFRIWEYLEQKTSVSLHIIWHGGEPSLLPIDYWKSVSNKFSPLVKKYSLSFAVQTNLIQGCYEVYDFWIKNGWGISTSIDGPYDLHSLTRSISKREFDRLLSNVDWVNSKQGNIGVICVINRYNFSYPERLLMFFEEIKANVRFNKVVSDLEGVKISYSEYFGFLERVAELWISSNSSIVVQPIFSDILSFLGRGKRSCDRNPYCFNSFLGISPSGEIYPCNRLVNSPVYLYGNVKDVSLEVAWQKARERNSDLVRKIKETLELPCLDCEARLLCGLGCKSEFIYGEFSSLNENFFKEFCLPFKKYVKTIKNIVKDIADEFRIDLFKAGGKKKTFDCERKGFFG